MPFTRPGSHSAIAKQPTAGPVAVGSEGLAGDEQGDRRVHGGVYKALHHYPFEHYHHWRAQLGHSPLLERPGAFGENISTTGLGEADLCWATCCAVATCCCRWRRPASPAGSSTTASAL